MIEVKRTDSGYAFKRVDDDGEKWFLGEAFEHVQRDGETWYRGQFDTRSLHFNDEEDLRAILHRRKPNDEIVFV